MLGDNARKINPRALDELVDQLSGNQVEKQPSVYEKKTFSLRGPEKIKAGPKEDRRMAELGVSPRTRRKQSFGRTISQKFQRLKKLIVSK